MATIGTLLKTWLVGRKVGEDSFGNCYYRGRGRTGYRRERRWVVYKGIPEASKVPAEWHAWLHGLSDRPPNEAPLPAKSWERAHVANPTGTQGRYLPPGSLPKGGQRSPTTGDYEPWRP